MLCCSLPDCGVLSVLGQGPGLVYDVRLVDGLVLATAGQRVTVQTQQGRLLHLLEGHGREVLCVDSEGGVVVAGGGDGLVLAWRLSPQGTLLHCTILLPCTAQAAPACCTASPATACVSAVSG